MKSIKLSTQLSQIQKKTELSQSDIKQLFLLCEEAIFELRKKEIEASEYLQAISGT